MTNLGVDTEEGVVVQAWGPGLPGFWGSWSMAGDARVYAAQGPRIGKRDWTQPRGPVQRQMENQAA